MIGSRTVAVVAVIVGFGWGFAELAESASEMRAQQEMAALIVDEDGAVRR